MSSIKVQFANKPMRSSYEKGNCRPLSRGEEDIQNSQPAEAVLNSTPSANSSSPASTPSPVSLIYEREDMAAQKAAVKKWHREKRCMQLWEDGMESPLFSTKTLMIRDPQKAAHYHRHAGRILIYFALALALEKNKRHQDHEDENSENGRKMLARIPTASPLPSDPSGMESFSSECPTPSSPRSFCVECREQREAILAEIDSVTATAATQKDIAKRLRSFETLRESLSKLNLWTEPCYHGAPHAAELNSQAGDDTHPHHDEADEHHAASQANGPTDSSHNNEENK